MIDEIKADFGRYYTIGGGESVISWKEKLWIWFTSYGLQALAAYRMYRWTLQKENMHAMLYKLPLMPFCFLLYRVTGWLYDIRISPQARIGAGCYIGHFGGIRIGYCRIGSLCNIGHQVVIGSFLRNQVGREVTIDELVWVGAHSSISEGVHLASGATISAGTNVVIDIPEKVIVGGKSSRIVKRDFDNINLLGLGELRKGR